MEERLALYPILEMMGVACCATNNSVGAVSTLLDKEVGGGGVGESR
jgi:hypothetical protein